MRLAWLMTLLVGPVAGSSAAEAPAVPDRVAGKAVYALCAACHGQQGEGNEALNAPRLAGLEPWYVERQLDAYRRGLRGTVPGDIYGAQMRPMAATVAAPAAQANLMAYLETLPDSPAPATISGDVAAGEAAFRICATCHGDAGEGNPQMGAPGLAGQSDWYLARQIRSYQQGLRGYHAEDAPGMQMRPMANTLAGEEAIRNVLAYINTLH